MTAMNNSAPQQMGAMVAGTSAQGNPIGLSFQELLAQQLGAFPPGQGPQDFNSSSPYSPALMQMLLELQKQGLGSGPSSPLGSAAGSAASGALAGGLV